MRHGSIVALSSALILFVFGASDALGIPAWARKYRTSCATCHAPFPKLNYFGKAFRNNGYRYPGDDEGLVVQVPAVVMGAESYKDLFPEALWPSDIPGAFPGSIRGISRFRYYEDDRTTSFEFPHEFELLTGGTFGDSFSFFGELEVENEDNENELGMDLMLQYDPRRDLHVRIGSVSPHPVSDHLRLTAAHYNAYDTRTTPGSLTLTAPNPNRSTATLSIRAATEDDRWRYRNGQAGIEVWGARNGPNDRGGLTWAVGVANGQGLLDANDRKDVYGRIAFKFGGYGELGGGDPPDALEFWRDDSFKVGAFFYNGESTNTYEGSITALSGMPGSGLVTVSADALIENPFNLYGVEFDWWFKDLNLFGLYLRQADDNPLGTLETIDIDAWFVEADYTVYPWLVGILRYGKTGYDFSSSLDPEDQQVLLPAVTVVARANIRFTFEAQLRLDDPGSGRNLYLGQVDFGF